MSSCKCLPNQPCWPNSAEWEKLKAELSGNLISTQSPITACKKAASSPECEQALKDIKNPFFIQSTKGEGLQSQGWHNAWKGESNLYAVEAENAKDIQAAVKFAHQHNLKVVIRCIGDDYLGRSSDGNALLIWTHKLRQATFNKAFVPSGCPVDTKPVQALTALAGTKWLDVYHEATTVNNR